MHPCNQDDKIQNTAESDTKGGFSLCRFTSDCRTLCILNLTASPPSLTCLCVPPRFDESLWRSVDLEGMTHVDPALQQVLKTGVRRLRCPRSFVEEQHFTGAG